MGTRSVTNSNPESYNLLSFNPVSSVSVSVSSSSPSPPRRCQGFGVMFPVAACSTALEGDAAATTSHPTSNGDDGAPYGSGLLAGQ